MVIIYVISIKSIISSRLLGGKDAKYFFDNELSKIMVKNILFDFSYVDLMSREFAFEYLMCKYKIKERKVVREVNLSKSICKVIKLVQKEIDKNSKSDNKAKMENKSKSKKKEPTIVTNPVVFIGLYSNKNKNYESNFVN